MRTSLGAPATRCGLRTPYSPYFRTIRGGVVFLVHATPGS
jgi:hypothetical protein